jgi:hypothetical protein
MISNFVDGLYVIMNRENSTYGGWKKFVHQLIDVIHTVSTIQGGAGFLPSTV